MPTLLLGGLFFRGLNRAIRLLGFWYDKPPSVSDGKENADDIFCDIRSQIDTISVAFL